MFQRFFRWLRHRWSDDVLLQLPAGLSERLADHVQESEATHSGEVRVCIEASLPNSYFMQGGDLRQIVRERAVDEFARLRVWDTEHNNGVLIYLCLAERAIELVADRGIQRLVDATHWAQLIDTLGADIRAGQWESGLCKAIDAVSQTLRVYFPLTSGQLNPNELPDAPAIQ